MPQNRMTPLKNAWMELYTPVTENMKIDMRMNLKTRKARRSVARSTRLWAGFHSAAQGTLSQCCPAARRWS